MGIHCEGFYNHLGNPFLDEIHGMDMSFSFGEEERVEVDNAGTIAQPKYVDDNSEHVENYKNVFAQAWFDIGKFKVTKVDKVGDDKLVNKLNKIQSEKYQRIYKTTA